MCIGNVEKIDVSEFHLTGRKMKCFECLYGSRNNCPAGITKYCGEYLGWLTGWRYEYSRRVRELKICHDQTLFFDIIDNEDYFDRDSDENGDDARWYVYCDVCGYIPYDRIAYDKCINKEHFVSCNYCYSEIEINAMKEERKYADLIKYDLDDSCRGD